MTTVHRARTQGEEDVNSVEWDVELTDEDVSTDGEGIIARNGIFQVAGRFLLSGLAFECKVLFKWPRRRLLVRSVSIRPIPFSFFPAPLFLRSSSVRCRLWRVVPLGQEASFPDIQMRSNIIYPASSLLPMPTRFTSRFPHG